MSRLETSLPIVTATGSPPSPSTTAELGLRHHPARVAAHADRAARADRAAHLRVLQEELRPVGVVDERVDVARLGLRLLEPRVAAALVRDAGAPDLRRVDRREQRQLGEIPVAGDLALAGQSRERIVVVEHRDGLALDPAHTRPVPTGLRADEAPQ